MEYITESMKTSAQGVPKPQLKRSQLQVHNQKIKGKKKTGPGTTMLKKNSQTS